MQETKLDKKTVQSKKIKKDKKPVIEKKGKKDEIFRKLEKLEKLKMMLKDPRLNIEDMDEEEIEALLTRAEIMEQALKNYMYQFGMSLYQNKDGINYFKKFEQNDGLRSVSELDSYNFKQNDYELNFIEKIMEYTPAQRVDLKESIENVVIDLYERDATMVDIFNQVLNEEAGYYNKIFNGAKIANSEVGEQTITQKQPQTQTKTDNTNVGEMKKEKFAEGLKANNDEKLKKSEDEKVASKETKQSQNEELEHKDEVIEQNIEDFAQENVAEVELEGDFVEDYDNIEEDYQVDVEADNNIDDNLEDVRVIDIEEMELDVLPPALEESDFGYASQDQWQEEIDPAKLAKQKENMNNR